MGGWFKFNQIQVLVSGIVDHYYCGHGLNISLVLHVNIHSCNIMSLVLLAWINHAHLIFVVQNQVLAYTPKDKYGFGGNSTQVKSNRVKKKREVNPIDLWFFFKNTICNQLILWLGQLLVASSVQITWSSPIGLLVIRAHEPAFWNLIPWIDDRLYDLQLWTGGARKILQSGSPLEHMPRIGSSCNHLWLAFLPRRRRSASMSATASRRTPCLRPTWRLPVPALALNPATVRRLQLQSWQMMGSLE